jgi:hypothetical protein
MDEAGYNLLLSSYQQGAEFTLITDRGLGELENKVILSSNRKLKFVNGGEIFNPKLIGGYNAIISLQPVV